ncbi:hypothetical protein [Pseudomonas sp. NPDC007930]|uniref:hypothetical protein n=1 Tax=Pseudomonas sp. NPDC007930 TaxID=3364417 RepID=UPI0036EC83EA
MHYFLHMKKVLLPMFIGRLVPVLGITLVFSLVAHSSSAQLATFAYALASLSVLTALTSMCLSATGNVIAGQGQGERGAQQVFSSGLLLAAALALVGTLAAMALAQTLWRLPGAGHFDLPYLVNMAWLYVLCVPFTIANVFFQLFHEGAGFASRCATVRTCAAGISGGLLWVALWFFSGRDFALMAMGYFFLSECLAFLAFIRLARQRGLRFKPALDAQWAQQILFLGVPVSFGLAGQKLYFYCLNERLAQASIDLVAQLAAFMNIAGLLLIPALALSQAHSVYVSKIAAGRGTAYGQGIGCFLLLMLVLAAAAVLLGEPVVALMSGVTLSYSPGLLAAIMVYLASSGFLALVMGHLRGMNDTLRPQLIVNLMLFTLLVPVIYCVAPATLGIMGYVWLQSAALALMGAVLSVRVWVLSGRGRF